MKLQAFTLIAIFSLSSCAPVVYDIPMEQAAIAVQILEEEKRMELKPIAQYDHYAESNGRVYGFLANDVQAVAVEDTEGNPVRFDSFFVAGGKVYISVKAIEQGDPIPDTDPVQYEAVKVIYYFEQTGADIVEIQEGDYPAMPASDFVTFDEAPFKVTREDYKGTDYSYVHRGTLREGWAMVDGIAKVDEGLYFSVPTTLTPTRIKGIYFWPNEGPKYKVLESGRIW